MYSTTTKPNGTEPSSTVIETPPAIVVASREEGSSSSSSPSLAAVRRQVSLSVSEDNHHHHQPAVVEKEEEVGITEDDSPKNQNNNNHNNNNDDDDEEEEESDYEYEYDDDDGHFSGFIIPDQSYPVANNKSSSEAKNDGDEEEEEDASVALTTKQQEKEEEEEKEEKQTWKEPSQEAVNMSLRAEKEKTGGKRRLASDLYKIMMTDTEESGFRIRPKSDDSLAVWCISLFQFDPDSNLAQDLLVLGVDAVELEMSFPDQYPFEPPFVRVVTPRFKRQTGFVMNGALCMELLTKDGWNPVNDIESVIVSIRSLLVVGDGRLQAAIDMPEHKRQAILGKHQQQQQHNNNNKRNRQQEHDIPSKQSKKDQSTNINAGGFYTTAEAKAAYDHLSDYHKKKGWDSSGWWAKKG